MDFTIEFNSGGNHGHQLKDALGGLTIGYLLNLRYIHTPYPYLDFFGIGYKDPTLKKWRRIFKYTKVKRISGPFWNGFDDYDSMIAFFKDELKDVTEKTLIVFDKALRVHPFQTIPWYKARNLEDNIFLKIQQQVTNNFTKLHSLNLTNSSSYIDVVIHINRGVDYDINRYPQHFSKSTNVRYMFNLDYYENIMQQIELANSARNVSFRIYTEELNSAAITDRFINRKNTDILIGANRNKQDYSLIYSIFKSFVEADILVCSNSSFSVICAYFRKDQRTIYHPHDHLDYLPEPNYIQTKDNGDFDIQLLQE
jgi:hypothetical protein